jgi:hypothetical protein
MIMSLRFAALAFSSICVFSASVQGSTNPGAPQLPFTFVENRGQADAQIRYIGSGPDFKAWFEDRGVILQQGQTNVQVTFENMARPRIKAESPLAARANYLRGNDASRWHTDLPLFGSIRYIGLWQGIDVTYTAIGGQVKAEYLVAPGADPSRIGLRFGGDVRIQEDGTLRIKGLQGDFMEDKPFLYQSVGGKRVEVAGSFEKLANGSIGFHTADYDRAQTLIIDPSIMFSGYFGGSTEDDITAVGIDNLSNIVVAGWTASTDLPAAGGAIARYGGGVDAFVASFLPNGGGLLYCTYLGGSGDDRAFALTLDSSRNVYVTGWTSSKNFPVLSALQLHLSGTRDAFVAKLNAAGNALIYSTYLGGTGVDAGYAIALDTTNSAVIYGDSTSSNLPLSPNAFQKTFGGSQDVFLGKISPTGSALTFLTYLGGSGVEHATCLSLGSSGAYFIGGSTRSANFPVAAPYQAHLGGGQDGFYAKVTPDGGTLTFSSYLGGSGTDEVDGIYQDPGNYLVVAGTTASANFPVTQGAFQTIFGGATDGFIARFSPSRLLSYSTFIGGSLNDTVTAMAHDFHGNPYVTGSTDSTDFPVMNPVQAGNAGGMDGFVVKLNPTLSTLMFGTYLGGTGNDGGNAIAVDFETSIVVGGQTSSGDFPTAGSAQAYSSEQISSFVTKIAPGFTIGVGYGSGSTLAITTDPWHVATDVVTTTYGNSTDLPISGDWDGSGKKRVGLFRNGTWILDINGNGIVDAGDKTVVFGQAGDVPVVGDWLGTGHIALGLFRSGTFILDLSGHLSGIATGQGDATFAFGQGGDIPVAADWSNSGTTKVGIFRNGLWIVDYTGGRAMNSSNHNYNYGQSGDRPVVGDWDSSGHASKIGIYRAGVWVLDYDGDNVLTTPYLTEMAFGFGATGYLPLIF